MMFSSIASLYRDDGGVLSEAARFTLCVVTVHSFTFVYSFIMEMIKRHNWFEDCILQKPRPEPDASLVHACLIKNLRSHYLLLPLAIYYFVYDAFYYMGMRMDYASWLQVSWETVLKDLFVSLVVNDTGFYWSHRALHIPVLYKAIHKQHHQFKQPVAQASEWAHPIEDLLGNIAPTLGGPFIMGSHMYVMLFWLFLRMWKTLDAHSGYSLPFPISVWHGLPGMLGSDMHDFHHESKEGMDSCFGSMTTFWDWACGTDKTFYRVKMNDSTVATKGGRSNKKNNHNDDPTYGVGLRRSPRKKE
jgi:sterol desaturase/sphingolipid hydroxylase (fatty acid hydroxylase superfamily)